MRAPRQRVRRLGARVEFDLQQVSVRRGRRWALRDITVALTPAHCFALLGANGAGKTQLLKLLATDVWPTPTGRERLQFRLGRGTLEPSEVKPRVAFVGAELQDKYAYYEWDLKVADLVATGLHGTDLLLAPVTAAQRLRVGRMLRDCGLVALAARPFLSLSYGQKRIALLARALVRRPDWLLLDEFYNGLDRRHRRRVESVLAAARRRGQAWIASAHRREDIPPGTTRVLTLEDGRLQSVRALRRAALPAAAPARRASRRAEPPRKPGAEPPRKPGAEPPRKPGAEPPRKPGAEPPRKPGAEPPRRRGTEPPRKPRAEALHEPRAAPAGGVLIRLRDVDLYVNYRRVLHAVNWELRAGEHWAVLGANGAGKSSLLKLLYGDLSPALGGRIERSGFPAGTPIERWKRTVGYVSPELQTDYRIGVNLVELVASGRYASIGLAEAPTRADLQAARRWLEFFDLSALAAARPRELSYGQMRRALIARALVGEPRILLLDEPLTGLDPQQHAVIRALLQRLMRRGVGLVIAVHHVADLPAGVERMLLLHKRQARQIAPWRDLESAT
jgi:molybdate transport system ATP-binding protein